MYKGDGIYVANSVSKIENGGINMLILNSTSKSVVLENGTQLATFEELESRGDSLNTVLPIKDSDETVTLGEDLREDQIKQISNVINKFSRAFSQNGSIGRCKDRRFEHHIDLYPEAKPFNEPLRRRPHVHVAETRRQVQKMLSQGIIEESSSPWASAYLLIRKKTGDYRLCIDFRKLNSLTKKFVYPLPHIEDCIDTLAGKTYFSLIDFSSGFWQVLLDEESRELTAFKTEDGLFHFRRMPFGLANAPSSFQRMVNAMFAGLRGVDLRFGNSMQHPESASRAE